MKTLPAVTRRRSRRHRPRSRCSPGRRTKSLPLARPWATTFRQTARPRSADRSGQPSGCRNCHGPGFDHRQRPRSSGSHRGWKRPFDDPILLPRRRQLVTRWPPMRVNRRVMVSGSVISGTTLSRLFCLGPRSAHTDSRSGHGTRLVSAPSPTAGPCFLSARPHDWVYPHDRPDRGEVSFHLDESWLHRRPTDP